jgi:hypothetical protein
MVEEISHGIDQSEIQTLRNIHDSSAALILDDIAESEKELKDPVFKWLFCVSCNFKTLVVILVQRYYDASFSEK